MSDYKVCDNGVIREATAEEITQIQKDGKDWTDRQPTKKLNTIKEIRLQKLIETDYLANSDVTMPDNIKTWRQSLRDIPSNHTDKDAYDLLLARDSDGNLTHSIWSKP
tara:strand:+ start:109 stop:432 length:324 start_codon:yes stop_codon:yes gene_type:complete